MNLNLTRVRDDGVWVLVPLRPRWKEFHQHPENHQWQNGQHDGREQTFPRYQAHLVCRVAEKALREQLPADHDIPAHCEDADQGQASGKTVNTFASNFSES